MARFHVQTLVDPGKAVFRYRLTNDGPQPIFVRNRFPASIAHPDSVDRRDHSSGSAHVFLLPTRELLLFQGVTFGLHETAARSDQPAATKLSPGKTLDATIALRLPIRQARNGKSARRFAPLIKTSSYTLVVEAWLRPTETEEIEGSDAVTVIAAEVDRYRYSGDLGAEVEVVTDADCTELGQMLEVMIRKGLRASELGR